MPGDKHNIRVAILDLYAGEPNEGMRSIHGILDSYFLNLGLNFQKTEFEVRLKRQLPGLDYDIYISTGGPGSPLESKGSEWENLYFNWIDAVEAFNRNDNNKRKKYVIFICHSFQLACRYFELGNVAKRKSTAFGVFPVHLVGEGKEEPAFQGLDETFYAVENRDYQVIQPNRQKLEEMGASVLAIEKERPHVPLERAVMAIRFNEYMLGTQFHPEVEPSGLRNYLTREDRKVISSHGFDKWQSMIEHLNDPQKIHLTYSNVLPNFLDQVVAGLK